MRNVTFEIDEGSQFIQGIAVMLVLNEEGEKVIEVDPQGEPDDYTSVGLLTFALDRQRHQMIRDDLETGEE